VRCGNKYSAAHYFRQILHNGDQPRTMHAGAERTERHLLPELVAEVIRAWIDTWNDNPRPYVWTKTADQILASIGNYCTRINDSGH
jgi:hypothetical protein